jgi:hypothetical protein
VPGTHLAWLLDSGSTPPGGYLIGSNWITNLVQLVARLFG